MAKKEWQTAVGEPIVDPKEGDSLLAQTKSDRERKRIKRQEEEDEAAHRAAMAKYAKDTSSSEAAVEKTGEKREDTGGIKVEGAVKLGTIDYQAILQKQTDERDELRKQAEEAASRQVAISDDLRERLHAQEMLVLKTSFEAQMQVLTKMIETSATKGSFMEQYSAVIETAKTLGFSQPETAGDLTSRIELEKLKFDQTLELKKMAREEKRADREFQRQLNVDAEERESKKAERAQQDRRDDMVAKAPQYIGGAIAQGLLANQGKGRAVTEEAPVEAKTPKGKQERYVEAGWGEAGEIPECPGCAQPIAIGPTATKVVCANCGASFPIRRVGEKPAQVEE